MPASPLGIVSVQERRLGIPSWIERSMSAFFPPRLRGKTYWGRTRFKSPPEVDLPDRRPPAKSASTSKAIDYGSNQTVVGVEPMYCMSLNKRLSSPLDQDCTLVAKSLISFIISGLDSRPSHSAFIRIRHALGASSPLASSSSIVAEPSGTNGVAACFRLLVSVMDS